MCLCLLCLPFTEPALGLDWCFNLGPTEPPGQILITPLANHIDGVRVGTSVGFSCLHFGKEFCLGCDLRQEYAYKVCWMMCEHVGKSTLGSSGFSLPTFHFNANE